MKQGTHPRVLLRV